MLKVYLAAPYARMDEVNVYASELEMAGVQVTSRWLNGEENFNESGALMDIEDVDAADIVISFTEPSNASPYSSGGRHVEFGYAYAKGKRLINISPTGAENVFHHLPGVTKVKTWEEARYAIAGLRPGYPLAILSAKKRLKVG